MQQIGTAKRLDKTAAPMPTLLMSTCSRVHGMTEHHVWDSLEGTIFGGFGLGEVSKKNSSVVVVPLHRVLFIIFG
jgi:hypothetical protein